jgi:hypothetical protein
MAVIDVGPGATDRAVSFNFVNDVSVVDLNNPANDTGTLDTFEIFAVSSNLQDCLIGTVYGSGTKKWTARDYETIGTVTYGSKQTFTGKSCTVSADDVLAIYATIGSIKRDSSGYSGGYYKNSTNIFNGGSVSFSNALSNNAISIYATGATAAAGNPYYYYLQQ